GPITVRTGSPPCTSEVSAFGPGALPDRWTAPYCEVTARRSPARTRESVGGPTGVGRSGMTEADVRLDHVTKRFGDTTAVDDLSLEVEPGEFFSLLGPSGCGKTTTLRMIGGF